MIKFTPVYLKKLEESLKESSYDVRYEKGNFKSGYCLLEAKKVVVINKFSTLESRIQSLAEIIVNLTGKGIIQSDLKSLGLHKLQLAKTENENSLFTVDETAGPETSVVAENDLAIADNSI